ncbi:hypothetical protein ABIA39_003705 [Nocardia sp. GAS34]|uniref:FHA domain-containing protein n=1 Tax=unclassified Nocardia TaxID=2637762 RepID=UPI003D21E4DA
MRDRQVEVVSGNHVVVRVAGVFVLVAHREGGPVRDDSAAMRAAEALSQLAFEAAEQSPGGPGRLIAQQVTDWLISEPGNRIDLGIVSQADTGGVAIFLHGAVTAVLAGETGVDYLRGADAAFTVDRIAEAPARAAAIFVDEEPGRAPELPGRGIGSLVEGVALASGAVIWFEGRRSRARDVEVTPVSVAPVSVPQPAVDLRRLAQTQLGRPADFQSQQPPLSPQPSVSQPLLSPQPSVPQPLLSPQPPVPQPAPSPMPQPPPLPQQPLFQQPPPFSQQSDAHSMPTEQGRHGSPDSNPQGYPAKPDRAAAPGVRVLGFKCARAHPSDPRSAFCTVCGMPVDQTQQLAEVLRPALGTLVLDDGTTFTLVSDTVLGRDPQNSDAARQGLAPFQIEDNSGGMSRAHAEIRLVNWDVTLVDRGSTNGTQARPPGYDWIRLQPGQPLALTYGTEVMLGNRVLRFDPAAPPPFG